MEHKEKKFVYDLCQTYILNKIKSQNMNFIWLSNKMPQFLNTFKLKALTWPITQLFFWQHE